MEEFCFCGLLNIEETGSIRAWGVGDWGNWSVGVAMVMTLIEFDNQPAKTSAETSSNSTGTLKKAKQIQAAIKIKK